MFRRFTGDLSMASMMTHARFKGSSAFDQGRTGPDLITAVFPSRLIGSRMGVSGVPSEVNRKLIIERPELDFRSCHDKKSRLSAMLSGM